MNATELYLADGRTAGIFFCGKCRSVARSEGLANECCAERTCPDCGGTRKEGYIRCSDCMHKADEAKETGRFAAAEKIQQDDYQGWIFCDGTGREGFSESVQDFWENWENRGTECDDEPPKYAWACSENHFVQADISDLTGAMEGNTYEDFDFADLNGLPEIESALKAFNEANVDKITYEPDYKRAVILTAPQTT